MEEVSQVCAKVQIQCIKAPCNPVLQTFGNLCTMKANKLATFLYTGVCKDASTSGITGTLPLSSANCTGDTYGYGNCPIK
jgi:hypothetical protein